VAQNADLVRAFRVGFTGTRQGMTPEQMRTVSQLLDELGYDWAHHGDCVGADADFHVIARSKGMQVMIHPPSDSKLRARLVGDDIAQEKPYLDRNRDIVNACKVLIATPKEKGWSVQGGGTWYTINYACQQGRETIVVWPDGTTDPEHSDGEVSR
jgi:hypothetical protein